MADVKLITPQQERLLSDSLVAAIKSANAGLAPDDALAKSASDHGLTPEFACRMVEAYNASKTVRHLQSTTGEKRAENFDLADRDVVLRKMYLSEPEKQALAQPSPLRFGKTYMVAPTNMHVLEKAASSKNKIPTMFSVKLQDQKLTKKNKPKTPGLHESKALKMAGLRQQLSNMGQEIRMELRHAKDQAVKAACELESMLRIPGHVPFAELEQRVLSTYGEKLGKKAVDMIWSMTDFERFGEKRASHPGRLMVLGVGPAYDAVRGLMSWLEKAAKVDQEMKEWQEKSKQVEKLLPEGAGQQPGGTGATFVSDPSMPRRPATAPLVDEAKALGEGAMPEATKQAAEEKSPGFSYDPAKILTQITQKPEPITVFDPQHESRLRAIRAKLVMNDMISNDPVLSAYAPESVMEAYNEIGRMAPGIATEPIIMRSLISRSLQTGGRMEPSEIKQLLDSEQAHRNIRVKGY
jgi:hypothetical protein